MEERKLSERIDSVYVMCHLAAALICQLGYIMWIKSIQQHRFMILS